MDYLVFDLVALLLPVLLLLHRVPGRRVLVVPAAVLALLALVWTAPWDDHLVRSGVWSYDPDAVLARIGAVPAEEYGFVVLEVLLVGAWALRVGRLLPAAQAVPATDPDRARRRGVVVWGLVGLTGVALLLLGGPVRYLGLLLVWTAPPLALQAAVAGDVLARRRPDRLLVVLPVAAWLCCADRVALAVGTWTVAPGSSTGLALLGLPVEEAVFFLLTCRLVGDGLLLAVDPAVLRRVSAALATRRRWSPTWARAAWARARTPAAPPPRRARTAP